MEHLVRAVRDGVAERNWYAALGLALTLPDICGRLESPGVGSQARYVSWCNTYLVPRYTRPLGPDRTPHVFLHGADCYALRCAVLHEGADDIVTQRARVALDAFLFVAPRTGWTVHCNQSDAKLQLQVDIFCEDICAGVDAWLTGVATNPDVQTRITSLMRVQSLENGLSF